MNDAALDIPGWSNLIDWFGYSPDFHDAKVEKIDVRTERPSIQLHTWHMTSETDEHGRYKLTKHTTVRFTLGKIEMCALHENRDAPGDGDVLSRLTILRWEHGHILRLESHMGKGGIIIARDVRIEHEPRQMTETTPLPAAALTALGLTNPTPVNAGGVTPLETPHGKVWVKTVEPPTKRARRAAIGGLASILPIPILRPSKAGKGGDTLVQQATQNEALRIAGIPVPTTLYADHDFLIQSDSGLNIEHAVNYAEIRQQHGWMNPPSTRS